MSFFSAVLLGILQGLTEFLPVSSSGHLVLAQHFFGIESGGDALFEVFLHLGTLLAVLAFFRRRVWVLLVSLFSWKRTLRHEAHRRNRNVILYLFCATLATGLIYLLFGDLFESLYAKPLVVAFMLLVTGIIVFVSDHLRSGDIPASNMGVPRAVFIGLIQGIAIIPGISRSGSTIAGSLLAGLKRRDAAEFSFLLSIPAILAANFVNFGLFKQLGWPEFGIYLGGFVAAFAVAYLVIGGLLELISRARLRYFAYYCWALGLISIALLLGKP
ncbi:MAG: undecaprenyl-diphosphate phosphatase [Candidatus Cloacimonetes bacterium]|nr:undecaprenyl-diphosphate phosphatase [Candidatus Cloacimonadota bacterium]MDY0366508.1 undecaprenyl-diphosphate phosphatase [Candidatus Syntrophosphaera sp.]HOY85231.1 undecaprenyl-diphosphate phosphatase [Candidatus Syntrophosphaera sp.]HPH60727.1 undecaprenyl-diphosphate phosphatase [Candidatus Syntrophosphaera sp.]